VAAAPASIPEKRAVSISAKETDDMMPPTLTLFGHQDVFQPLVARRIVVLYLDGRPRQAGHPLSPFRWRQWAFVIDRDPNCFQAKEDKETLPGEPHLQRPLPIGRAVAVPAQKQVFWELFQQVREELVDDVEQNVLGFETVREVRALPLQPRGR
jgi:hypothetical protein